MVLKRVSWTGPSQSGVVSTKKTNQCKTGNFQNQSWEPTCTYPTSKGSQEDITTEWMTSPDIERVQDVPQLVHNGLHLHCTTLHFTKCIRREFKWEPILRKPDLSKKATSNSKYDDRKPAEPYPSENQSQRIRSSTSNA